MHCYYHHIDLIGRVGTVGVVGGKFQTRLSRFCAEQQQVEFAIECDARDPESVREMFETAQRAALFPGSKLHALDSDKIEMAPELVKSLKYVFDRADVDNDGFLNDAELNEIQKACFTEAELGSHIIEQLRGIADMAPGKDGVLRDRGFTWPGFLFIWQRMLENGRYETFWVLLRHCGFNDKFQLVAESLPLPTLSKGQEHVLADQTITFLTEYFEKETQKAIEFAKAFPKTAPIPLESLSSVALHRVHFETIMSFLPTQCSIDLTSDNLWYETRASLPNAISEQSVTTSESKRTQVEENTQGLSLDGWLSFWHRLTLRDPTRVSIALPYLGFGGQPLVAGAKRSKTSLSSPVRSVAHPFSSAFVVHVVGPAHSGRSHLVRGLLNYPYVAELTHHQRTWSNATIAISSAACVFKHSSSSAPASPKSRNAKPTPSKKNTNAPIAVKSGKPAPSAKATSWLTKGDINYQRVTAWEQGQFIFQKNDLDLYLTTAVDALDDRQPDAVLVVYDVSDLDNFRLVATKLREMRQAYAHLSIVLVGAKGDLKDVTHSEALQLTQELAYSSPPIIVSAKRGEYGKLVSTLHQTMITGRSTRWSSSSFTRLGLRVYHELAPHWPKLVAVAGVAAVSWIALAHWGPVFRPYWMKFVAFLPSPGAFIGGLITRSHRALTTWWRTRTQWEMPEPLRSVIERPAPTYKPVAGAGSSTRLAPVQ